jgi:phosphoserine phosphatase
MTTIVVLSLHAVPAELELALAAYALVQDIQLVSLGVNIPSSISGYVSKRWSVGNRVLTALQRDGVRQVATAFLCDAAFLSPPKCADNFSAVSDELLACMRSRMCSEASSSSVNHWRVLALDMDSTLINIECIDEIAAFAGKSKDVAKITEATMRGEMLDFGESLRQRVALLAGVPVSVLEEIDQDRLKPNQGAAELLAAAEQLGLHTMLLSGGFTFFAEKLQRRFNIAEIHANTLEIQNGKLTGKVLGSVVDGEAKASRVENACRRLGCSMANAIAIGDGANDLPMMRASGLSVAFRAKPIVREQADAAFDRVGLDAVLLLL